MSETIMRQLSMLRSIPREPGSITVQGLLARLQEDGYEATPRTIQRDLNQMSALFGITCKTDVRTQRWFYPAAVRALDIPGMGAGEALVFYMAERHLDSVLPRPQLNQLKPYFDRARAVLEAGPLPLSRWRARVGVIQRSPRLGIPKIATGVIEAVHEAMLKERSLRIRYRRRGETEIRHYSAEVQGLVLRDGMLYVVALLDAGNEYRHLALHRAVSAAVTDEPARIRRDFDLVKYLHQEQAFALPDDKEKTIQLVLRVNHHVHVHLSERRLSEDQTEHPLPQASSGRLLKRYPAKNLVEAAGPEPQWEIRATVAHTEELLWWLLGFGDQLEVIRPLSLRKRVADTYARCAQLYA